MTNAPQPVAEQLPEQVLEDLLRDVAQRDAAPRDSSPLGRITDDFFQCNWTNCRDGLLQKTRRIRIEPLGLPAPRVFRFEIDTPFKRRHGEGTIEYSTGPVRGTIYYRPDLLLHPELAAIAVTLDEEQDFYHPNFSRKHHALCLGDLPGGPHPLDALLEHYLFPILSYQNRRPSHAADVDAARYFALDPQAMEGLECVEPLY